VTLGVRKLPKPLESLFARTGAWRGSVEVTRTPPHLRDTISVAYAMRCVIVALVPCLIVALLNTGHQANLAMAELAIKSAPGWRGAVLDGLGIGYDPWSIWANMWHGGLHYLPVLAVTAAIGGMWERLFARTRGRERTPGLAVIALLFSLSLPPSVPLWQAALGMSFGIVVAKEVFGGTGKNFINPALTGLAFLYVTYPKQMMGESAWTVVEGFTGATALRVAEGGAMEAATWAGTNWMLSFLGAVPGAFGETSVLACIMGAVYLLARRVASGRIITGALIGMIATAQLFNTFVGDAIPLASLSWHWHLTLGSFAFGVVFLATDPVTAAATDVGRWIYGILIGVLVVVIRVANVTHPDGVMFAILFGNIVAPLIDYLVMRANIGRRNRRSA
jgi:Na+-transporting NADH:ubiquinone oxidoreductase subunit B